MIILGIETSCDETSASVIVDGILKSNVVSSQYFHSEYGGIVPELASRAHIKAIIPIIRQALLEANVDVNHLDAVAATQGPGLIGSLLVGLNTGKAIALSLHIPFLPIHHIEAHIFSTFLQEPHPEFPFLCLVVSGGHTLLIRVSDVDQYELLGSTIDDAAGEAYDKVAKMLGLGFPGGPEIDKYAHSGNPKAIDFPRPRIETDDFDFSFSGLKTSVLYFLRKHIPPGADGVQYIREPFLFDVCASFQQAVIDVLTAKTFRAAEKFLIRDIAVSGGVSANSGLKEAMHRIGDQKQKRIFIPSQSFTTDNAAMVAMLAWLKYEKGFRGTFQAPAFARIAGSFSNAFA